MNSYSIFAFFKCNSSINNCLKKINILLSKNNKFKKFNKICISIIFY